MLRPCLGNKESNLYRYSFVSVGFNTIINTINTITNINTTNTGLRGAVVAFTRFVILISNYVFRGAVVACTRVFLVILVRRNGETS